MKQTTELLSTAALKQTVLLWCFLLTVIVRPLSVCLWRFARFVYELLGKSCSLGFPLVLFYFICRLFVFLSRFVSEAGCGIWLYRFLINVSLSTLHIASRINEWSKHSHLQYFYLLANPKFHLRMLYLSIWIIYFFLYFSDWFFFKI